LLIAIVYNTRSWPKRLPPVLIAGLAMLALSVGFILSGELLSAPTRPADAGVMAHEPVLIEPVAASAAGSAAEANDQHGVPLAAIEKLARDLGTAGGAGRRGWVLGAGPSLDTSMVAITLARTLGNTARVVVVDLAFEEPGLSVASVDSSAPGIGELVLGAASFGQIITRDRYSRVHVIGAGRAEA